MKKMAREKERITPGSIEPGVNGYVRPNAAHCRSTGSAGLQRLMREGAC
jgi:hypothetical protein